MMETDTGGRRWRLVALVGVVLPLLAATLLVWSTTGREQHLDRVPVAVVNDDTVVQKPQPMAAGRALAASLTQPDDDDPTLDWTLADDDDATAGLADGTYYAVLHIPSDFSAAILSTGGKDPKHGRLTLTSNGAASMTVPYISQAVASAAASSLGNQSTQSYLGQVYDGFNQIAQSNQKAADSAASLASGADQLAQGATSLDEGADELAASMAQLVTGARELDSGTASLAAGARQLATGASQLAAGADRLDRGAADVAGNARTLAGKEGELARQARRVATGATRSADSSRRLSKGSKAVAVNLAVLARVCERSGARDRYCRAVGRARDRAIRLAEASVAVSKGARAVAGANRELAAGAGRAAAGARELAAGAGSLERAADVLAGSARDLSSGAAANAQGAQQIDQAAGSLAAGTVSAEDGAQQLTAGSASVRSGADSVDSGAQQLSSGLAEGAAQSPTYSTKQQKALKPVVAEPVVLTSSVQHTDHGNGWLLALVIAIVLWLAALTGALVRGLGPVLRHAEAPVSSGRLASLHLGRAVVVALLQGVAVVAALLLLQVSTASTVALTLLTTAAAVVFTLICVALYWAFGRSGLALAVLLLLVQAAALGNVVPLETAPELVRVLNGFLPLTAYVDGASQLVSGGQVGSLVGTVAVLVAWGGVAAVAALLVVRRRRSAPALATAPPSRRRAGRLERMTGIEPA